MPKKRRIVRLSTNIRYLRDRGEYTQEFIADLLGVSRFAISKYEHGDRYPTMENVRRLAHLFNVTVDSLLNDDLSGVFASRGKEESNA